jgi:ent-kaurene oxidase
VCTLQLQSIGEDVSSVYVEEFGREVSKEEIYHATVFDIIKCAIEVDWREFFPYLSWVPNKSFETRVATTESRRSAVVRALVNQQKKRIERGEVVQLHIVSNCFTFDELLCGLIMNFDA